MIGPNSRNLLTDVVQVIDPVSQRLTKPPFVDLRQRITSKANDDQFITVDDTMSWGNIGLTKLTDARFYWVVADLSNVVDPFSELQPGVQLRGPSIQRLLFDILAPFNQKS